MPTLDGEDALVHINRPTTKESTFRDVFGRAKRETEHIDRLIRASPGPTCITILGLDGSDTDINRTVL
jgi:hypothetical protein